MKVGETKQTSDGAMKVGRTLRDGFVELATDGCIPRRFGVHAEVLDLIESLAGERLKAVPPPDPDVEAAERMVSPRGLCNAAGSLSWEVLADCWKSAEYREWVTGLIVATRREARAEGHAAGVAEAIRRLESMSKDALDVVNQDAFGGSAAVLRKWANGAK